MAKRYVMIHKTDGVFIGCSMGFAFFAKLDSAGQPSSATFSTIENGKKFFDQIGFSFPFDDVRFEPVETATGYATIAELKAAGLADELGDMEADALRYATPMGQA